MALAIALFLITVAAVLFQFLSPWWATPLASNWRQMDDTLTITLVVTGVFFVGINLFLVYMLIRYRHRKGRRAAYEPENQRLERWLILGTTLAIMLLLAPGLFVYAEYLKTPRDALVVEVLGQQWQWRYRFPGQSDKLGQTDTRFINPDNPFGIDPADPNGQGNILIDNNELHLPLNRPVRMLLRSRDVLHDFFVPPFRARMNMVPGMVTTFWFTPTKAGRYEVLCAQLCGIGHSDMRGFIVVEDAAAFAAWLKAQPTFAQTMTKNGAGGDELARQGKLLAQAKGCIACHTVDGNAGVGPTWKGLYGKTETMADGSTALVDEAYLKAFIRDPAARGVKGFPPIMPKIDLTDQEVADLIAYIKSTAGAGQPGIAAQKSGG
jgi:cytochrome c oxidase subunit II